MGYLVQVGQIGAADRVLLTLWWGELIYLRRQLCSL